MSKITVPELLKSISHFIKEQILDQLKSSPYFSLMADESTDIASKEELSICARWLENGRAVEHFLGIVNAHEVHAEAIIQYLLQFLSDNGIPLIKLRGLGFDGTNTMSGNNTGVQVRIRHFCPSALFVHCTYHRLQLAAIHASSEHTEVKRMLGTLLTIWKAFHYSPKKAEKLTEIEAVLHTPELKMLKPSDTRWLAQERCVRAVRQTLPAIVTTFEAIYEGSGDAEAYGIVKLMCTYKFLACFYMLCDVLHIVAKFQGSLQAKELLATVPVLVKCTLARLIELKEHPGSSTWFKDHTVVFSDQAALGNWNIVVNQVDEDNFTAKVYRPYIQSVIDHITSRLKSSDIFSAFAIFNPSHLQKTESLPLYGENKLQILTNFYGTPQSVIF